MISRRQTITRLAGAFPACLAAWAASTAAASPFDTMTAHSGTLLKEPLTGDDHKIVSMDLIEFRPGESGKPHRHPGPVFGYILEGSFMMQFLPDSARKYSQGQAFYEPAMHVHAVCRNLSRTRPAKFLAVMIRESGQPATLPAL
ncbi:MAG: cupin domain-containing protein [Terriglobia bacterium]